MSPASQADSLPLSHLQSSMGETEGNKKKVRGGGYSEREAGEGGAQGWMMGAVSHLINGNAH